MTKAALKHEFMECMEDMTSFLDERPKAITVSSEASERSYVEKVTIYDEKITVEIKSGLESEVEA